MHIIGYIILTVCYYYYNNNASMLRIIIFGVEYYDLTVPLYSDLTNRFNQLQVGTMPILYS